MLLSLIVPFRNRDEIRVKRCLQSIENQTFKDFEIIFSDYGSKENIRQQTEQLCSDFSRLKYIFSCEEGHFWNRAHALNNGIKAASGKFFMTVDIDMIYCPDFLENAVKDLSEGRLLHYACFYLPENFNQYDKLPLIDTQKLEKSDVTSAKGIFFLEKSTAEEVGGFDEFFKVWGMEDMDFHRRLSFKKLEIKWLDLDKNPVFHQWHPFSDEKENMPKGWKQVMIDYYHAKTERDIVPKINFGEILSSEVRKNIFEIREKKAGEYFHFVYPLAKSYADFSKFFAELPAGAPLAVRQNFSLLPQENAGRATKYLAFLNRFFAKTGFSYRFVEVLSFERELPDYYAVRDFLFYFIHAHQAQIKDYFFEYGNNAVDLTIIKK